MTLPGFQDVMLPILKRLEKGEEIRVRDLVPVVKESFDLTQDEMDVRIPSGRKTVVYDRVGWATTYMRKAGLLVSPRRGVVQITSRGKQVMVENPERVNVKVLKKFPEFKVFHDGPLSTEAEESPAASQSQTPRERIEAAYAELRGALEEDVLDRVKSASSRFFEQTVVELLVRMGYGGTLEDAGKVLGRSHDGGIDGIIKEDRLGLDAIYIQAKKWADTVGRPEIQKFVGSLQGHRARKGVFITTASFSPEARDYVRAIDMKVILLDGPELAKLMFEHNVGVSTVVTYEVKQVDSDYFSEE